MSTEQTTPLTTPLTDALDADLNHDIATIEARGGSLTERVSHVTANLFKHAKQLERELATERARADKSDAFREELRAKWHQAIEEKREWQARAEAAEEANRLLREQINKLSRWHKHAEETSEVIAAVHRERERWTTNHNDCGWNKDLLASTQRVLESTERELAELKERQKRGFQSSTPLALSPDVEAHIRADRHLPPATRDALLKMIQCAGFAQLSEPKK